MPSRPSKDPHESPESRKAVRSKPRPSRRGHGWGLRLFAIFFLCSLILAGYIHHLDGVVRVKFEGKRWAVPAHVYARPLELFPGAQTGREQMLHELSQLGYRSEADAPRPGTYALRGETGLRVHSRSFEFWDGKEPSRQVDVEFTKTRVSAIRLAGGEEIALLRLEPFLIASIHPAQSEDRVLLRFQDLPQTLIGALIAAEDREFFGHHGVSLKGISRAMWANVKARRLVQGGSTLTQQLVKNFYLTQERTLERKINEALMALVLDYRYGKEEIMEAYANEIFLGQDGQRAIHGFGLASRYYFNRPLQELDVAGQALLIALIRGPSFYNPVRRPERAKGRRDMVLDLMAEYGVITAEAAVQAKAAPLGLSIAKRAGGTNYPAFMDLVRRQLSRDYRLEDLNSEGLRIYTTLDPWVQDQAESALVDRLAVFETQRPKLKDKLDGAMVVVGRDDGEVQSVVGGRSIGFAGFNRALDAVRPIGSLVKPAVYLTALARPETYNLATPLKDEPVSLSIRGAPTWSPKNYDGKLHGSIPLYDALAQSYNLATVRLGLEIGVGPVANTLRELGVVRPIEEYPSLFLGTLALSPLEVAQVYQTLAAGGYWTPLRTIREVLAQDGKPLQRYPLEVRQAVPGAPVHLLTTAMQKVVQSGTAASLSHWLPANLGVAGKTGTTDEMRDSWFAGFTGDRVAVTWVGRDDNEPTGLTGATGALQVWGAALSRVSLAPLELIPPDTIVFVQVDPKTGLQPGQGCAAMPLTEAPFVRGFEPLPQDCVQVPERKNMFWEIF
ncbi:MAG: penicillin-binding protein 1B [Gammaproteobacteria bacterium RIFOXYA12_FULL_61_12]|nr:MAG: penicillin-binding protein 1B [Gammaproteobacteria bacterium RIFOXYD12_FULL_61_37]OGT93926.1 MAG: penicillin-binding protein 1B [Gammaproteobacteria bacterium RIFOXYA12_FULL_61_12]